MGRLKLEASGPRAPTPGASRPWSVDWAMLLPTSRSPRRHRCCEGHDMLSACRRGLGRNITRAAARARVGRGNARQTHRHRESRAARPSRWRLGRFRWWPSCRIEAPRHVCFITLLRTSRDDAMRRWAGSGGTQSNPGRPHVSGPMGCSPCALVPYESVAAATGSSPARLGLPHSPRVARGEDDHWPRA